MRQISVHRLSHQDIPVANDISSLHNLSSRLGWRRNNAHSLFLQSLWHLCLAANVKPTLHFIFKWLTSKWHFHPAAKYQCWNGIYLRSHSVTLKRFYLCLDCIHQKGRLNIVEIVPLSLLLFGLGKNLTEFCLLFPNGIILHYWAAKNRTEEKIGNGIIHHTIRARDINLSTCWVLSGDGKITNQYCSVVVTSSIHLRRCHFPCLLHTVSLWTVLLFATLWLFWHFNGAPCVDVTVCTHASF